MNHKEEFEDYLFQIQNELLKNKPSPFYSHLLKDFMNDSGKFMSFYDFVMNSQEIYDFEIYKGLLGPLNCFSFYAEIGKVYNKMIKTVISKDDDDKKMDDKSGGKVDDKGKDEDRKVEDSNLNPPTNYPPTKPQIINSLFLVSLLDSHSSKFLKNLFSPSLSISLILFSDFLFENKFFYESFKILNVVSQSILILGYPPKEVMDKYWFLIGNYFLREGSYFSFLNCINKENCKKFGSKKDLKKIIKIIEIREGGKGEGEVNEFKKLLLKKNKTIEEIKNEIEEYEECEMEGCIGGMSEDKVDIEDEDYPTTKDTTKNYSTNNTTKHNAKDYSTRECPTTNEPTLTSKSLISLYVPFDSWDFYFNSLDKEIDFTDIKDFQFISFLKKNNLNFEIKGNKIKIRKYKFKSFSDKIYEIIEKYKEEGKGEGNKIEVKKASLNKKTPLPNKTLKPIPSYIFKDNFSLKKSKFKIYSLILSEIKKNLKMKNENLLKNRKKQNENLKRKEEEERERLRKYYEKIKELKKEIGKDKDYSNDYSKVEGGYSNDYSKVEGGYSNDYSKVEGGYSKVEDYEVKEYKTFTPSLPSKKTSWRDLEVNDLQKTTYSGRQYRTKQKEDDILSSRTISSFDRTEEERGSIGSKVYKPSMNIKDLKILKKGEERRDEEDSSKGESSRGKYIPPNLRK